MFPPGFPHHHNGTSFHPNKRRDAMVIITISSFPTESAKEIGKRFMERSNTPDFITMKGPYILPRQGDGIQSVTLYEVDRPTRLAEAVELLANEQAKYFGAPGYTYSINVCLDATEALKTIGM
jgi:hypothetical protein